MANFFTSLFKGKKEEENNENNGIDKNNKKNFDILKYDGIRAQRMGQIDYAIKCYENALEIEPDFEVMGYLSQIYARMDEPAKAIGLLKSMIEMEPEQINTYLTLSNVYYMQEDYPAMTETLDKALAIDENDASAHYLSAKSRKSTREYETAIDHLTKAINTQPEFTEALLMRAEVYIELEKYPEAAADIEQILKEDGDEEHALLLRGRLHEATGKQEEAETDYRRVTELNPFHDQAFINLARLYINQKKPVEAIHLCDEAIELNPGSATLYHERGRAKLLNGDKEGSESDMKLAIQMKAEGQDAKEPEQQEEKPSNSLGLPFS